MKIRRFIVTKLVLAPACATAKALLRKRLLPDGGVRVNALASISDYDHWPPRQSPAGVRGIPSHDAASHKSNLHARFVGTDDTCNTFNVNTGATR